MKVPIKNLNQAISQKSKLISLLSSQIKLLERLVHEVFSCRDQIFFPLSTGIFDVSRELVHLSQGNHINALYMVSRSFLERAVNILYLDCSSDEERISFSTHSIQKGARSLKRRVTAGPLSYELKSTAYEEYIKIPEIQKAVIRFSSQKGSEITRWTKLNILERIENIHFNTKAKAKLFLLFALHVYDDSSEALHGTSYGCIFHYGGFKPFQIMWAEEENFEGFYNWTVTNIFILQFAILINNEIINHFSRKRGYFLHLNSAKITKAARNIVY